MTLTFLGKSWGNPLKVLFFVGLLVLGVLLSPPLKAATFNVTNSAELTTALTNAAANESDNTINLAAGSYTAAGGFIYTASSADHALTLTGDGSDSTFITATAGDGLTFQFSGSVTISGVQASNSSGKGFLFTDDGVGTQLSISISSSLIKDNGDSGIWINDGSIDGDITISESQFENNTTTNQGGGLFVSGVSNLNVMLRDNTFSSNTATGAGGGAYIVPLGSLSTILLTGNTFENNTSADNGGGANIINSGSVTIGGSEEGDGNTFTGNVAFSSGGIYAQGYGSGVTFVGNTLTENRVDDFGEAGGVKLDFVDGLAEFSNNVIQDNIGGSTPGFGVVTANGGTSGSFHMNGNIVSGNIGNLDVGGGLIALSTLSEPVFITNNLIVGNSATGGNPFVGGLVISESADQDIYLINNTIADNTVEFYFVGGLMLSPTNAAITFHLYNNIFWNNTSPFPMQDIYVVTPTWTGMDLINNDVNVVCVDDATPTAQCNTGNDFTTLPATTAENNLINIDPLFLATGTDPLNYYSLQSTSLVIGQGTASAPQLPTTDFTDSTLMSSPPDLGALQYCVPDFEVSITLTSTGTIMVRDDITWNVTITNNANCVSDDNTLTLSFTNATYQSADQASLIKKMISAVAESDNVSCTGSGLTASCTISQIDHTSSLNLNVVSTTLSEGSVGLSASLTNALNTASSSGSGSAIAHVDNVDNADDVDNLSGDGCSLNEAPMELSCFWIYAALLSLLAWRRNKA